MSTNPATGHSGTMPPPSSAGEGPDMRLVSAMFDFKSTDGKILSFDVGEEFIVIKATVGQPLEWIYVVNSLGQLGYIPTSYVQDVTDMSDEEYLRLIDKVASQLDMIHNDATAITERQVKHAQIRLAQLRCHIVQNLLTLNPPPAQSANASEQSQPLTPCSEQPRELVVEEPVPAPVAVVSKVEPQISIQQQQQDQRDQISVVKKQAPSVPPTAQPVKPMNGFTSEQAPPQAVNANNASNTKQESKREISLKSNESQVEVRQKSSIPPPTSAKPSHGHPPATVAHVQPTINQSVTQQQHPPPPTANTTVIPPAHHPQSAGPPSSRRISTGSMLAGGGGGNVDPNKGRSLSICDPQPPPLLVPDHLVFNLVERVRISADLSHDKARETVKTVLIGLSDAVPRWERDIKTLMSRLDDEKIFYSREDSLEASDDLARLRDAFRDLWACRNDEQQRSWPVHEDEGHIAGQLNAVLHLMGHANPAIVRRVVWDSGTFDNINMLVQYFQMEPRRPLRLIMLRIFLCVMIQFPTLIKEYFLSSVLPAELAMEMIQYPTTDPERYIQSAITFTALFSSAHRPPIAIYEHINEKFVVQQLELIEGVNAYGEKVDYSIPIEYAIAPLLAFNLHFECPALTSQTANMSAAPAEQQSGSNLVLRALRSRTNAGKLTENLISYFNWEEDITLTCLGAEFTRRPSDGGDVETTGVEIKGLINSNNVDPARPNAVLKLLIEMLSDTDIARLFYYNDVRVIVDIVIRQLENLSTGDEKRTAHLILLQKVLLNTAYRDDPHKLTELRKAFENIENEDPLDPAAAASTTDGPGSGAGHTLGFGAGGVPNTRAQNMKRDKHLIKMIKFNHVPLFK